MPFTSSHDLRNDNNNKVSNAYETYINIYE